jgi:hypothetical protein
VPSGPTGVETNSNFRQLRRKVFTAKNNTRAIASTIIYRGGSPNGVSGNLTEFFQADSLIFMHAHHFFGCYNHIVMMEAKVKVIYR